MARLLVVEDDQALQDVLRDLLTYEGYETTLAAPTEVAIRAAGAVL